MGKEESKTIIIVPEYNEGERGVSTVKKILINTKNRVIVIDDGSDNGSYELLLKKFHGVRRVELVRHNKNMGKGAAMKTGVEKAWREGARAVIFIDADGQHDPRFLKYFEKKLEKSALVMGYRDLGPEMPLFRKWGNLLAVWGLKKLFGIQRKDILCGYISFKKEVYPAIRWHSRHYGVEAEIAAKIGRKKIKFQEIKVPTIYIDKYKGVGLIDAIKILLQVPRWYFEK